MARALVVTAGCFVALGVIRLILAYAGDEGVDDSGLRPHDLLALMLFALGAYALLAAHYIRSGRYRRVAVPAVLALVSVASVVALYVTGRGGLTIRRDDRDLVDVLVYLGLLLTTYAALAAVVIVPATYALGWLADRVPSLRQHGVGDAIRRWLQR